ncbi:MAG TPA: phosphate acyltransferase PlsX [Thermomicrobiales bacterium]|nr:phosphate acyltransferase PlsX [Thermomicrobiales bacterium]
MHIAIDAMGGDHGPAVIVPGALAGARHHHVSLLLVGRKQEIEDVLSQHDTHDIEIDVVDATQTIEMDDHPAQAVRRKTDNSISVALRLVKEGRADAMLSAGNSGAVMAGALMTLGRINGIDRPAITTGIPNVKGGFSFILDLGAVTDPKPINMVQFAVMGQVYAQAVVGIDDPTVGLLSNGEEESKGNNLVHGTWPLLNSTEGLNFVGNVEGKDIPAGTVDVYVTDGFTGNVVLKTIEGVASMLMHVIREEITSTLPRKLAALTLKPAFREIGYKMDYAAIGGAPLLGVDGAVIICHGRSSERAIDNAVGVCKRAVEGNLAGRIRERVNVTHKAVSEAAQRA